MQEDNFNDSKRNDPYEIIEDNDSAKSSVAATSFAEEVQPNDTAETAEETAESSEPAETSKNDETNSISSDLIRGHINTIILRALYERDKYGYEIMNDIEQKSHGQYSLKQPTLYSALKRLENQGYIKAYWKTDEVSNGGRRKYFTLTENGKEITEKNLAEWEYSRTIIDSLISDKSFDFSQPAPTPVDFTILRNSVSRVPVIKNEESEKTESASEEYRKAIEDTTPKPEAQPTEQPTVAQSQPVEQTVATVQPIEQAAQAQPLTAEQPAQSQPTVEQTVRVVEEVQPAAVVTEQQAVTTQTDTVIAEQAARAEARRVAHENYLRLISEPVREPEPQVENIVPNSENVDTDKLIYNNRPETERDYKNLIDGIFRRAVSNGSVQTNYYVPPQPKPVEPEPKRVRLVDRGRADGVAVATSSNFDINSTYATRTTYNKGITLLKCSSIVLAVTVIEFIFCFIFLNQLKTTWVYPVVILLLGLAQFALFGIMALQGYGKNCVRPTTNSYISSCIILTIIAILIISALSFLLNVNPTSASDIMKMIVIPSITALNITLFAVCFKLFIK